MFHALNLTLINLLRSDPALAGTPISFAGADERYPPSSVQPPALMFFLYDIRENLDLRTNQWDDRREPDGTISRTRAPAHVDCSYLITAWPRTSAPELEYWLLGEVLKILLRHRQIPREHLAGELVGQEPPIVARVVAGNQPHSLGEFWQAMGGRPKATLHYCVTVSFDVFAPTDIGPEVLEKVVTIGPTATSR